MRIDGGVGKQQPSHGDDREAERDGEFSAGVSVFPRVDALAQAKNDSNGSSGEQRVNQRNVAGVHAEKRKVDFFQRP